MKFPLRRIWGMNNRELDQTARETIMPARRNGSAAFD